MRTLHRIFNSDSTSMRELPDGSADLVVTSPPYPMIEMWDASFSGWNPEVGEALAAGDGRSAYALMHRLLDGVWKECGRVLKPGGFACVNVGDAVRTVNAEFRLYPNHGRVSAAFEELGFDSLPMIHWNKTTNAPTKFMGSGMLPAGAYVTLEHEYILVFRKQGRRRFETAGDKKLRMRSAFFWEERNIWFSDSWDLAGERQGLSLPATVDGAAGPGADPFRPQRSRSAAYPLELPLRLILMYSLYDDLVVDPFLGRGTTLLAAAAAGRISVGYEIDPALYARAQAAPGEVLPVLRSVAEERIGRQVDFVERRTAMGKKPKYQNLFHGFPVVTRQETALIVSKLHDISAMDQGEFQVEMENMPAP
jgi:modification methylase